MTDAQLTWACAAADSTQVPRGLRVAIMWGRVGPYHLARAQAAAARLGELGCDLQLGEICSRDVYDWKTDSLKKPPWAVTLFPGVEYSKLRSAAISEAVRRWLDGFDADVVVTNGWAASEARAALKWASERSASRAIVMSETRFADSTRWPWKEWAKRWLLRRAHAGLVGGRVQADYLASLGIPKERIFLGYNAVDNAYFRSGMIDSARDGATESPAILSPYFFACARLIARKNFDGLLRAYSLYRKRSEGPIWRLVISGSGPEQRKLRGLCKRLGLDDLVHWAGFLQYDELPRWYAKAAAFIHPARSEAWGLVVNEAAACSVPLLVARSVGASCELLEEGVNGFGFDAGSDEEMADVMLRVAALDELTRSAFGRAARARVDLFGPDRFASGLVSAIDAAFKVAS